MALPGDGTLSTSPAPAELLGARALEVTPTQDFEDGGVALNNPSEGLLYQVWEGRLASDGIYLRPFGGAETLVFPASGITEFSFTFDQNMRPAITFVQDGVAKLRWYDSDESAQVVTEIGAGVVTPRIALDDKRFLQRSISDIILAYVRDGNLYTRIQRDRYGVEYLMASGVAELIKIGMNRGLRFQFNHTKVQG